MIQYRQNEKYFGRRAACGRAVCGKRGSRMEKISRKNWALIWVLGMAGQICWNIENSWFNTFVYRKIAPDPSIVAWMVGVSAVVSTFCTFLIGTASDRLGRRRPFIAFGYILWGVFTIGFGVTEFLPKDPLWLAATCVVLADAVMSFFGSMGNDGAFNPWTTDISSAGNRGKVGGALAVMPVFATIFGAIVSGIIIDALDFFAFFTIMGGMVIAVGVLCLFTLRDAPGLAPNRDPRGFWHQFAAVFDYKIDPEAAQSRSAGLATCSASSDRTRPWRGLPFHTLQTSCAILRRTSMRPRFLRFHSARSLQGWKGWS